MNRRERGPIDPAEREIRRMSRRGFLWGGAAILGAFGLDRWLATRRPDGGIPWPFRRAFEWNEAVVRDLYRPDRLAPTFSEALAVEPPINGDEGMKDDDFDPAGWKLRVEGLHVSEGQETSAPGTPANPGSADKKRPPASASPHPEKSSSSSPAGGGGNDDPDDSTGDSDDGSDSNADSADDSDSSDSEGSGSADSKLPARLFTLADLRKLQYTTMVTEFKCVEGWSKIVHWGGYRFADFLKQYPPATASGSDPDVERHPEDLPPYIAIETPDGGYYVALDTEVALHPQTLLCTHMNGQPLTADHGAPLRLVTPLKYGIKQIKRIGRIRYTTHRPPDFWAEQGYDWYAGH